MKPKGLGKGLSALLPTRPPAEPAMPVEPAAPRDRVVHVRPDEIERNPVQPRGIFNGDGLNELAQSIRANGIIQPLIVRRHEGRLQLVAGERRLRAAKIAQLTEVPVMVQEIPDERLLEITLIENLQREDLNPIEAATAFQRLEEELQLSAEEIGLRTGKDRSTIANLVRLLQLPAEVKELIAEGKLSAGHGRSLLGLPTTALRREMAEKAVARGWSVREVERVVKRFTEAKTAKVEDAEDLDPNVKAAITEMERVLGTKVRIVERGGQRGRIEIEYYSGDDLDRIYGLIVGQPA